MTVMDATARFRNVALLDPHGKVARDRQRRIPPSDVTGEIPFHRGAMEEIPSTWRRHAIRPSIAGVGSAMPEHRFAQETITSMLKRVWEGALESPELLDRFHLRMGVDYRHLAFPLERYAQLTSWGQNKCRMARSRGEAGSPCDR